MLKAAPTRTVSSTTAPPASGGLSALCLLALLALLGNAQPLAAAEEKAPADLETIEQQLKADQERAARLEQETEALRAEMGALRDKLVAAAGRAQDLEQELSQLEQALAVLEVEEGRARAKLRESRRQMAGILQGLQRLSLVPRESLILAPGTPVELARGGMLLQAAYPKIEEEALALRADLADLASLRADILDQRAALQSGEAALIEEREALAVLLVRKEALEAEASGALAEARANAQRLAREAQDLKDLIKRLEKERRLSLVVLPKAKPERVIAAAEQANATTEPTEAQNTKAQTAEPQPATPASQESEAQVALLTPPSVTAPAEIRDFPGTQASLVLPARGVFSRRFGDVLPESSGGRSKGLFIQTREGAQVVAPYDGRVVYAQPFRGYGLILIIEHQGKYHSLLSGLERIDAVEGQWVLAGEPIGSLGSPTAGKPELYLELRRDGEPIDPLPWLAQTKETPNGEKVKS